MKDNNKQFISVDDIEKAFKGFSSVYRQQTSLSNSYIVSLLDSFKDVLSAIPRKNVNTDNIWCDDMDAARSLPLGTIILVSDDEMTHYGIIIDQNKIEYETIGDLGMGVDLNDGFFDPVRWMHLPRYKG